MKDSIEKLNEVLSVVRRLAGEMKKDHDDFEAAMQFTSVSTHIAEALAKLKDRQSTYVSREDLLQATERFTAKLDAAMRNHLNQDDRILALSELNFPEEVEPSEEVAVIQNECDAALEVFYIAVEAMDVTSITRIARLILRATLNLERELVASGALVSDATPWNEGIKPLVDIASRVDPEAWGCVVAEMFSEVTP